MTCYELSDVFIFHSSGECGDSEDLLLVVGALGKGFFDQVLKSAHESRQVLVVFLVRFAPFFNKCLLEFWLLVHSNEFRTEERIWFLSEWVDLFEVLTVHIVDDSTNPTVGGDIGELEVSFHPIDPGDDVDVSVALELLDLTLRAESSGCLVMMLFEFALFMLRAVLLFWWRTH